MCAPVISRMADRGSTLATWQNNAEKTGHTFARFALPITWDFAEYAPLSNTTGGFVQSVDWVFKVCRHLQSSVQAACSGTSVLGSATSRDVADIDLVVTDPPYYDAIPYSDLMDFFYVWLRRSLVGLSAEIDAAFSSSLGPKWDHQADDGELIDDASRFDGDKELGPSETTKMAWHARSALATRRCGRKGGWWSYSPTSSPTPGRLSSVR